MPKMKTKKALAKRVKRTGSGQLKRGHAYVSHFAANKESSAEKVCLGFQERYEAYQTADSGLIEGGNYDESKNW